MLKRRNDLVYRIQLGPKTKAKVVHFNCLWKYQGENIPTWLNISKLNQTSDNDATNSKHLDANLLTSDSQTPVAKETRLPRRSTRHRQPPERYQFTTVARDGQP